MIRRVWDEIAVGGMCLGIMAVFLTLVSLVWEGPLS